MPATWKFATFLFPDVRQLQMPLGSTDFLEACQEAESWFVQWPLLESLHVVVDEPPLPPQIQDRWEFYKNWLEMILEFIHRREERLKTLKICTSMEVETDWGWMLVDQLVKDVDEVEFTSEIFDEAARSRFLVGAAWVRRVAYVTEISSRTGTALQATIPIVLGRHHVPPRNTTVVPVDRLHHPSLPLTHHPSTQVSVTPMQPIHAVLPLELLLEILRYVVNSSSNRVKGALQVAQIDTAIRSLAINTAAFWDTTKIRGTSKALNLAELCLHRSKDVPFSVTFSESRQALATEPGMYIRLIEILTKSAHRLASLNLDCTSSEEFRHVWEAIASLDLPILEDLHLESSDSGSDYDTVGQVPLAHAPCLRTLTLSGVQPISPPKSNGRLRVLRFKTGYPDMWASSQIAITVNQFVGIKELSFCGAADGWFPTESYDMELKLQCPNLVSMSLHYTEPEFVVWILKALNAPSLRTVRINLPDDTCQAQGIPSWDPLDATRHENVSELIIEDSKVSSGPENGFVTFLINSFPNIKYLEFPFGDMKAVCMCPAMRHNPALWGGVNSLKLAEEDAYFHNGGHYESCLESLMAFVRTRPGFQRLTIEGPMAMDRPLTTQLIQQLGGLVDQFQVGPEDDRPFGTGKIKWEQSKS